MNELVWIAAPVCWLVCAPGGYLNLRRDWRNLKLPWTVGTRRVCIFLAILIGPISVVLWFMDFLGWLMHNDTPADW